MLRAVALSFIVSCAPGLDVGPWVVAVDQPDRWDDLTASHHDQHAAGGLAIGAAAYLASAVVLDDRAERYAVAIAAGVAVGVGYEVWQGRRGTSYVDPVDAAYVTLGAAAGALAADLAGRVVSVSLTRTSAAVSLTRTSAAVGTVWRF